MSILPDNSVARWLLALVLIAGVYFFIGFLVPILAALVVGFASWPLYQRLLNACGNRNVLAASVAILIIVLGLVIPIAMSLSYAIKEFKLWVDWLLEANRYGAEMPVWLAELPRVGDWLEPRWQEYLGE